ncbi:hypothetical protein PIB30_020147, partial [Stylosanthes scabra]|nr:hypothetical protein [Stylosanthes scabra]
CCDYWDGIQCHELTGHVIGIHLRSSQLYGSMDPNSTLFSLLHLQSLDLSDNDFNHSQIPAKIVPPQLSHLSNLLSLDLRSCTLQPLSPYDLVNHLQLKPSTLTSLTQNSTKLEQLRLNFVSISSSLPHTLTNLTSLQRLSLYNCELHGEFPVGIFHLPNLTVLDLGRNQYLRGMLPNFLSRKLVVINLPITSFYGTLPTSIGNLTSLSRFAIPYCNFYGTIPSSIGNLTELVRFHVADNGFDGEIPQSLFRLENLEMLSLEYNSFEGKLAVDMFWKLKMLNTFSLSYNRLSLISKESVVNETTLPPIQWLGLSSCNLTGEFPTWIMNLTSLNHLDLSHNYLQGEIPSFLFMLENLTSLDVSGNWLEGRVELHMLSKLTKLTVLALGGANNLSFVEGKNTSNGVVMDYLGRQYLHNMVAIDLSCNKISGEIPDMMGSLNSLVVLNLSNNMFTGSIPSSLGKLSNLEVLDLSFNSLSGNIPQQLTELTYLDFFNVSFNNLSGPIPENKQFSTFEDNSYVGNKGLCGIQLVNKCEDQSKIPQPTPDGDQDSESGSFFELYWMVILTGYGGGLIAGLALGNAFGGDVFRLFKMLF